jgi:hypothetical protein
MTFSAASFVSGWQAASAANAAMARALATIFISVFPLVGDA